jgi:hypothetical protein
MVAIPEKPFAQVITPEELIVPASAGITDQLKPVLLLAMVKYVVVVVPLVNWQVGSVPAVTVIGEGVLTVGTTFTVLVTGVTGALHPLATTEMVAIPEKPSAQVIIPDGLIVPAPGGDTDQVRPVWFDALVTYVVVVVLSVNWHTGSVPADRVMAVGAPTEGRIITCTVPATLVHPFTVAVTLYVPSIAEVAFGIVGFRSVLVKLFGPVQEYVAPAIGLAVRFIVPPSHTGLLLPAVGVAGIGFTTTTVVPAGPVHPFTVALTLYVPAIAVVAFGMVGF